MGWTSCAGGQPRVVQDPRRACSPPGV